MSAPPADQGVANRRVAAWARQKERGSTLLLRFMCQFSLFIGRRASRCVLAVIAAYFLLAVAPARRASLDFLQRVLGRSPTLRERYRHFFYFASTIHDRVFLLNDRADLFHIEAYGHPALLALQQERGGVLLFGGHVGSFDALRAAARFNSAPRVCMAMYEENARKINSVFAAINPNAAQEIIPLGKLDSMLTVHERLKEGRLVGVLADRSFGEDKMQAVQFLGETAHLPTGPFRMAALLKAPVVFMTGLYRGGNRYDIHLDMIADFGEASALSRDARIQDCMQGFATRLEQHCRAAPYNWFNFYDFWNGSHVG